MRGRAFTCQIYCVDMKCTGEEKMRKWLQDPNDIDIVSSWKTVQGWVLNHVYLQWFCFPCLVLWWFIYCLIRHGRHSVSCRDEWKISFFFSKYKFWSCRGIKNSFKIQFLFFLVELGFMSRFLCRLMWISLLEANYMIQTLTNQNVHQWLVKYILIFLALMCFSWPQKHFR